MKLGTEFNSDEDTYIQVHIINNKFVEVTKMRQRLLKELKKPKIVAPVKKK